MTAIVLPDIDRSTFEDLKKRIPDLSDIDLPNLPTRKEMNKAAKEAAREAGKTAKEVGKTADETIDRLLGRSRAPVWPWIAAGIGLVAVAGVIAAWFAWFRRPTWQPGEQWTGRVGSAATPGTSDAWPASAAVIDEIETPTTPAAGTSRGTSSNPSSPSDTTAEDRPLGSAPYEEA